MKDFYLQEQCKDTERRNPASSAGFGEVFSVFSRPVLRLNPKLAARFVREKTEKSVANCRRSVLKLVGGRWSATLLRRDVLSMPQDALFFKP
jgi:hypothetical protein